MIARDPRRVHQKSYDRRGGCILDKLAKMPYLRAVELVALFTVVISVACRGLFKYYPAFIAFLITKGVRSLCLFRIDEHDPLYGMCWALSVPVLLVLQVWVLLELTEKIVHHYPKIDKAGAKLIVGSCFAAGTALGAISSIIQFGNGQCPWYVSAAIGACKTADWVSVGILLFVSVWIRFRSGPFARNVYWHRGLLTIYIGVAPGVALMLSTVGKNQRYMADIANWSLETIEILSCCVWALVLKRSGELVQDVTSTMSDQEFERIDREYQEVFKVLREEFRLPKVFTKD
jgi:hypothetical protein